MRDALVQLLLAGTLVAAFPAASLVLQAGGDRPLPPVRGRSVPVAANDAGMRPLLDSLTREAAAAAPFRANRTRPAVAYDPDHVVTAGVPASEPATPKPQLVLSGIVWGGRAKAMAVLEGLPGVQGPRVVRVGENVGGIKLRGIRHDSAIVTGFDTLWALKVRAPWQ